MKKTLLKALALGCISSLMMAGSASALLIDFTDASLYGSLDDNTDSTYTQSYSNLDVTLSAYSYTQPDPINPLGVLGSPLDLTFNGGTDAPGAFTIGNEDFLGQGDGIGIGNDEISSDEALIVSFAPYVNMVNRIYFLDLFWNGSEEEESLFTYNLTDDSWTRFFEGEAYASTGIGGLSIAHNVQNVLQIGFTATPDGESDFSLAGIDVTPVPEPATMLLFGTGLAGLMGIPRRRRK